MAHQPRRRTSEGEYQSTGRRAHMDGVCAKCDDPILKGSRIVPYRGRWIHPSCASGYGDE